MIGITRAHLEEDAAKNVHVAASGRLHGATATLVDFNRGGTPLVEIVTEPDLHDAETAKRFLQLLRQTVVELGLSDAELEKGSMRFDVNVSVRPAGSDELRTRTELKNMNSFNFAAKGIEREIARQIQVYEAGGDGPAGDAAFRSRAHEDSPPLALQGGGAGLPLLPGARPRAGASAGRAGRAAARARSASCRARGSGGIADTLSFYDADVLVTGGPRPALVSDVVDAGADPKEAANVLANQFVATGISTRGCERRTSSRGSCRRAPRSRARHSTRRSRTSATTASRRRRISSRRSSRTRRARPGDRPDHRGEPGPGRAVPAAARRACSASSSAR